MVGIGGNNLGAKTNLQGEACKFLLDCIFQFLLHAYTHFITVSARDNQFERIGKSKREVCYSFTH